MMRAVGPGFDNGIRAWDAATGVCTRTLTGHAGTVYALAVHRQVWGGSGGWWVGGGGMCALKLQHVCMQAGIASNRESWLAALS